MERMTINNVRARCDSLNRRMENRGSIYRYSVERRNGYTALDRYRRDPDATINLPDSIPGRGYGWLALNTVRIGTASAIGEFLHAMMVALDDADYTG